MLLSWINPGYKIIFSKTVKQLYPPPPHKYSESEKLSIIESIQELEAYGAISTCVACKDQFISNIFLRPKPNGKMRLILNLKQLNKFIDTSHFKIEDFRTTLKLMSRDCFMATLDIKNAYHFVKIHPDSRKYLRFQWDGKLYQFNVLPFGLSTAPYVFTKMTKPIVKTLRSGGFLSTIYLDDLILIGSSYQDCVDNILITKQLLCSLGFVINDEKSMLVPSNKCKYLGYILDSNRFEVSLPKEKRKRIKEEVLKFIHLETCTVRQFAQLIGLLVSACPAIEYGWLYTKDLERCKYLNLDRDDNYERLMNIPNYLQRDLKWWLNSIDNSVHRILEDKYEIEIFSDASTTGWGAACGDETASGQWSNEERNKHINYLELLAAYIALKIFAKNYSNCQILLRIDNSTAVSYINRMGGVQFPHLTEITKSIWQWCESRKMFIYASYIPSKDNTIADTESRRNHPDIEWELSNLAFDKLSSAFGQPQVDLFASRINKKCLKYVSWHKDPDAFAINAFTLDWSVFFFYAFPPISVILKTLRKIILNKATGIVVVPLWETQPWFPVYLRLLVSNTITFSPCENALISHSSRGNIKSSLTLVAGVLCGRRYCDETYPQIP